MMISGSSSSNIFSLLADALYPNHESVPAAGKGAQAKPSGAALQKTVSSSSSPMAGHFTHTDSRQSRYVSAQLDSLRIDLQLSLSEKATATSLLDMFDGSESEATIRRRLKRLSEKKMIEDAQEKFAREREAERNLDKDSLTSIPAEADNSLVSGSVQQPGQEPVNPIPLSGPAVVDHADIDMAPLPAVSASRISIDINV